MMVQEKQANDQQTGALVELLEQCSVVGSWEPFSVFPQKLLRRVRVLLVKQ
jgi:hypothetical protein